MTGPTVTIEQHDPIVPDWRALGTERVDFAFGTIVLTFTEDQLRAHYEHVLDALGWFDDQEAKRDRKALDAWAKGQSAGVPLQQGAPSVASVTDGVTA